VAQEAVTDLEVLVKDTLMSVVVTNLANSRGFIPGFRGTLGFSFGGFPGRGDHGRFDDRGFRGGGRDFRDFARDSFALASSGRALSAPISSSAFLLQ
jgi:hypothetical protein